MKRYFLYFATMFGFVILAQLCDHQKLDSWWPLFLLATLFLEFFLFYRARQNAGGEMKTSNSEIAHAEPVDYSKIPAVMDGQAPKPVDMTGNVPLHNEETFTEDLRGIGIDRYKKE